MNEFDFIDTDDLFDYSDYGSSVVAGALADSSAEPGDDESIVQNSSDMEFSSDSFTVNFDDSELVSILTDIKSDISGISDINNSTMDFVSRNNDLTQAIFVILLAFVCIQVFRKLFDQF